MIALSEHVDYWDRLGWKDPFSSPAFSRRQEGYGHRFHLDSVYTPEVVIDGVKRRYSQIACWMISGGKRWRG